MSELLITSFFDRLPRTVVKRATIRTVAVALLVDAVMPAMAQEWAFFDAPVKVEKTWYDELGEGNISTGVTISDALDQYDMICINDMELGGALQGIYVRHSDSYYQEIDAAPSDILPDERGSSWTTAMGRSLPAPEHASLTAT